jgi:hypothetical protein
MEFFVDSQSQNNVHHKIYKRGTESEREYKARNERHLDITISYFLHEPTNSPNINVGTTTISTKPCVH